MLEPGGFGGVKMTGDAAAALPVLGRAGLRGRGESYGCVNRRFFDCTDGGAEGLRAFDLRDV